jgi:hypothetical protein
MDDRIPDSSAETPSPPEPVTGTAPRRYRLALVVAAAVAAGIAVWAVAGRGDTSKTTGPTRPVATPIPAVALSAGGLATLARAVKQPIYWAGPRKGFMYELHRTSDGNVYIRYLPPGVQAGAKGADYLTIATYPFRRAYIALKNVTDGQKIAIAGGGVVLVASGYKKSVHLAYPNVDYEVEVYDPSAARVLELARSGRVRPAG